MARPIWTGVISFGLVSVPVKMYSATSEHEVSFHQFEKGTSDRIRYQRVNERTGTEVDYGDIVKGADVGGGKYVMLDQDELESVAPGRSRSLDIHTFVDLDEIDPIYYQKTYYLAPGSDETAKTYALLRDAMADTNRAAIGTLVMRAKEYLVTIRPDDNMLVLETMFFADEVRDPRDQVESLPGRAKARPQELRMAAQLIESMAGPWQPAEYRDSYTDRVNQLIKAKKAGKEVKVAEPAPAATDVMDLMAVLRASVDAAQQRRSGSGRAAGRTGKTAPAGKKAPAGKNISAAKNAPVGKKTRAAKKATAVTNAPAQKATAKKGTAAKKTPAKKAPARNTQARSRAA